MFHFYLINPNHHALIKVSNYIKQDLYINHQLMFFCQQILKFYLNLNIIPKIIKLLLTFNLHQQIILFVLH